MQDLTETQKRILMAACKPGPERFRVFRGPAPGKVTVNEFVIAGKELFGRPEFAEEARKLEPHYLLAIGVTEDGVELAVTNEGRRIARELEEERSDRRS